MEDLSQPKTPEKNISPSKYVFIGILILILGLMVFGIYRNFQYATQTEKIGAQQQPITFPATPTPTPIAHVCAEKGNYTINQPQNYTFSKACLFVPNQIYTDDNRFTFFNLPPYLRNISYIKTPNFSVKEDKQLQWSISLHQRADVYIMYRKIPGQNPPAWIKDNYQKVTPDNFVELITYALRRNELGLIGVYDIYKYRKVTTQTNQRQLLPLPTGTTGQVSFGPASDNTVTAYSMYVVAVRSY